MTPPLVQLASYGPLWALAATMLAIFALLGLGLIRVLKWVLEKQYASFREDHDGLQKFIDKALEKLTAIHSECRDCHADNIARARELSGQSDDKVINSVWNSNERIVALIEKNNITTVAAIGREADRTISELEMALLRRENNDLSREHIVTPPPSGTVGSQVRESMFKAK